MTCYFQGCDQKGITKEHIPPRAFFPDGEKDQLLTVKSCAEHNNAKSIDDLYVLAQICMNASPSNRAREVWENKVVPQLQFNNGALRKKLAAGAIPLDDGSYMYPIDVSRFDNFFTALSCGLVFKICKSTLPNFYEISHIYHSLSGEDNAEVMRREQAVEKFYSGIPKDVLVFGDAGTKNEKIYTATFYGVPGYRSSITIVHLFFGKFKVTSMLSLRISFADL